jgi:RNA polymerase sigma-70 factor, ECF subfamily
VSYDADSIEGRLLDGDPEALGIVSRWVAIALSATRYAALRHTLPDLHQESMLRVIAALQRGHYAAGRELRIYVQAIARHTALRTLWTFEREQAVMAGTDRHYMEPAASASPEGDEHVLVVEALASVPRGCRDLIARYFLEDQSYEEIAAELAVPVGTVKSRLFRCLKEAQRTLARGMRSRPGRGAQHEA